MLNNNRPKAKPSGGFMIAVFCPSVGGESKSKDTRVMYHDCTRRLPFFLLCKQIRELIANRRHLPTLQGIPALPVSS